MQNAKLFSSNASNYIFVSEVVAHSPKVKIIESHFKEIVTQISKLEFKQMVARQTRNPLAQFTNRK